MIIKTLLFYIFIVGCATMEEYKNNIIDFDKAIASKEGSLSWDIDTFFKRPSVQEQIEEIDKIDLSPRSEKPTKPRD